MPQWQFHCGKPPPAAEPRTRTRTGPAFRLLPVVQVGRDFGTQLDELKLGLDPRHGASLLGCDLTMHVEVAAADPVAMVYGAGAQLVVVALGPGADGLRTGAARAVRACRDGRTVAWALDVSLPVPVEDQVRA